MGNYDWDNHDNKNGVCVMFSIDDKKNEHEGIEELFKLLRFKLDKLTDTLNEFITDIESSEPIDDDLQEFLDDLKLRVEKLERHKNYQIDENRKISKRLDELEILIKNFRSD